MKLWRFFWPHLRRYLPLTALALVTVLGFATTTVAMIFLIEPIFGEVLLAGEEEMGRLRMFGIGENGEEGEETPPEEDWRPEWLQDLSDTFDVKAWLDAGYLRLKELFDIDEGNVFYFVPILFVAVYLVRSIFAFVSGYTFQRIGLGITTDVRNQLYQRILQQSSRFHSLHPSGELVSRVVNDVNLMQVAVSSRLLDLFLQGFTLIGMTALLLSTHFKLALICLVLMPLILIPIVRFGQGIRGTSHRSQERMADLAQLLAEGVRGHRVVKAFGMEDFEYGRFRTATGRHLKVNLWAQVLANLSSPVIESLAAIGSAALLVWAAKAIRADTLTVSVLMLFLTNLLLMYDPIRRLNKVNLMLQEALAAAHRVADLIAVPNDIVDATDGAPLAGLEEEIRFDGVSFAYERDEVLKKVDLSIRRGEMIAFVGPSGAGKSTLVNLLPRFFDPDEGAVRIDGRDVREAPLASLRALIGIVTQETLLFNDTVRANIAYGREEMPLEAVEAAAQAAYADEFIRELPKGYDTVIGEGGSRLSGGQRQRLAIARALLKDAPILVLDEATSQLDSQSEALVQKALYNLMEGRTTLVVAHRLSTVIQADRIVVMEAGKILEVGSHAELLAGGGLYQELHDLQFKT